MRHGSFFSGVGGPEYAAELMGWENVFHCEINPFGQRVLKFHYPNADSYSDIKTTNFKKYAGTIDVLSGGWPCQENSNANQSETRKVGLQGERSGLFFEYARGIDEFRPTYAVAENVANIFDVNGRNDFFAILSTLAGMGYNAEWRTCHAANIGAPHKRSRVFIVAYPDRFRLQAGQSFFKYVQASEDAKKFPRNIGGANCMVGPRWNIEPPVLCLHDGLPFELDLNTISKPGWRDGTVKAFGNSIVPEIPLQIFKGIEELDKIIRP